jgi:thymidylate synthase ThyX|tara:strand:- start:3064 stop:3855 length:792 start_codon:yes stop_codon:yes gene_type:complete
MIQSTVLLDSITPSGTRLLTLRVTVPKFILAELNTHRVFSRNAGSSRALNSQRQLVAVSDDPVFPVEWGIDQPGMQADTHLDPEATTIAEEIWRAAMQSAIWAASQLHELGVHKQLVNRLVEPFSWVDVIVSSTEWENFFTLRLSTHAQPEMRHVAEAMHASMTTSTPTVVSWNDWHLPAITAQELLDIPRDELRFVAAGRLARVSYGRHTRSWEKDRNLAYQLADNGHWSPFEHVAMAVPGIDPDCRNYRRDWQQMRAELDT